MVFRFTLFVLFFQVLFSPLSLAGIVVDGSTSDWGVTVIDGTSTNKTPSNFGTGSLLVPAVAGNGYGGNAVYYRNLPNSKETLFFQTEDQDDTAGTGGYLGPYYGGQNYDAEFLGASLCNGKTLSILVVSGQRPDNGLSNYSPGDIRISTSVGVFGIEVGGNANDNNATTYNLNTSGYTTSVTTYDTRTAGSIWKTSSTPDSTTNWVSDAIPAAPDYPVQLNHSSTSTSIFVGSANFIYTKNSSTNSHAMIELSFDAFSVLGSGVKINSSSWYPSCGNDSLIVTMGGAQTVPEPSAFAIIPGLSFLAIFRQRLRRRRQCAAAK
ncbi:MAG: hypothetical protein ACK52S_07770 [Pirellula sp.]